MNGKTLTTQEAWEKAAYYLTMCCGFPKDTKRKLFKAEQSFCQATNQHKIVFTLLIDHPVRIPNNKPLAEKLVEPVDVYYRKPKEHNDETFKLLRQLIDIIELQAQEKEVKEADPEHYERDCVEDCPTQSAH